MDIKAAAAAEDLNREKDQVVLVLMEEATKDQETSTDKIKTKDRTA